MNLKLSNRLRWKATVQNIRNVMIRLIVNGVPGYETGGREFDKLVRNKIIRHVLVAHLSGHYATHNVQNLFQTVL